MSIIFINLKNGQIVDHTIYFSQLENNDGSIAFMTSNQNKAKELENQIKLSIESKHIENLVEIQSESQIKIVEHKCVEAFKILNKETNKKKYAVLVEDVSLEFNALNGMPGPYIKWFLDAIGSKGLFKMLSSFDDKSARAVCTYAFMDSTDYIVFCQGCVEGTIVEPRGDKGWGWDDCFEVGDVKKTFAELDKEVKQNCSHRAAAIKVLRNFLLERQSRIKKN